MKSDIETLKEWCQWMRKLSGQGLMISDEGLERVKATEDLISKVGTFRAERDALKTELAILKDPSDGRCMEIAALRKKVSQLQSKLGGCTCGGVVEDGMCHRCAINMANGLAIQVQKLTAERDEAHDQVRFHVKQCPEKEVRQKRDRLAEQASQMTKVLDETRNYLHWNADALSGDDMVGDGRLTARYKRALANIEKLLDSKVPERPICIACEKPISGKVIYDGDATAPMHEQCPERNAKEEG